MIQSFGAFFISIGCLILCLKHCLSNSFEYLFVPAALFRQVHFIPLFVVILAWEILWSQNEIPKYQEATFRGFWQMLRTFYLEIILIPHFLQGPHKVELWQKIFILLLDLSLLLFLHNTGQFYLESFQKSMRESQLGFWPHWFQFHLTVQ